MLLQRLQRLRTSMGALMSRVFFYLEEGVKNPTVILSFNGQEIRLSPTEFHGLLGEASWLSGHLHSLRKDYYKSLAYRYKEVQNVALD
jgi:hypothetical protein